MAGLRELEVLYSISQMLNESSELESIITPILKAVSEHLPMSRGAITLLNRDTHQIMI